MVWLALLGHSAQHSSDGRLCALRHVSADMSAGLVAVPDVWFCKQQLFICFGVVCMGLR